MKKIKVKQPGKTISKTFDPLNFVNVNRNKMIIVGIVLVALALAGVVGFMWRKEKAENALALFAQANSAFLEKNYETSLSLYELFVSQFPRHKLSSAAVLGIAYNCEELGLKDKAIKSFSEVKSDSLWAKDAALGVERLKK